jgi:3-methyl-2-oxobutanoate hydroxymethyltransferase
MGGYRVQGKTLAAMDRLAADAHALEDAGAVAIVLEGIPRQLAARITHQTAVPTIGIGAGPDCDGQILVFHDLFNLTFSPPAKFTRQYADAAALFTSALTQYRDDVMQGSFPSDAESYHLSREVQSALATTQPRARKA